MVVNTLKIMIFSALKNGKVMHKICNIFVQFISYTFKLHYIIHTLHSKSPSFHIVPILTFNYHAGFFPIQLMLCVICYKLNSDTIYLHQ
jgi:hypothetical protein